MASVPSTKYVRVDMLKAAMDDVVPTWLVKLNMDIIATAKARQTRLGRAERTFWGVTQRWWSRVYAKGPYVEQLAWDLVFRVPVGGFKYGDMNPITGELFPGGVGKGSATYIHLEDKFSSHGETEPVYRARSYSRHSGEVIGRQGFFSIAIREHLGGMFEGAMALTPGAFKQLDDLAMRLSVSIAGYITSEIVQEARAMGFSATTGELYKFNLVRRGAE